MNIDDGVDADVFEDDERLQLNSQVVWHEEKILGILRDLGEDHEEPDAAQIYAAFRQINNLVHNAPKDWDTSTLENQVRRAIANAIRIGLSGKKQEQIIRRFNIAHLEEIPASTTLAELGDSFIHLKHELEELIPGYKFSPEDVKGEFTIAEIIENIRKRISREEDAMTPEEKVARLPVVFKDAKGTYHANRIKEIPRDSFLIKKITETIGEDEFDDLDFIHMDIVWDKKNPSLGYISAYIYFKDNTRRLIFNTKENAHEQVGMGMQLIHAHPLKFTHDFVPRSREQIEEWDHAEVLKLKKVIHHRIQPEDLGTVVADIKTMFHLLKRFIDHPLKQDEIFELFEKEPKTFREAVRAFDALDDLGLLESMTSFDQERFSLHHNVPLHEKEIIDIINGLGDDWTELTAREITDARDQILNILHGAPKDWDSSTFENRVRRALANVARRSLTEEAQQELLRKHQISHLEEVPEDLVIEELGIKFGENKDLHKELMRQIPGFYPGQFIVASYFRVKDVIQHIRNDVDMLQYNVKRAIFIVVRKILKPRHLHKLCNSLGIGNLESAPLDTAMGTLGIKTPEHIAELERELQQKVDGYQPSPPQMSAGIDFYFTIEAVAKHVSLRIFPEYRSDDYAMADYTSALEKQQKAKVYIQTQSTSMDVEKDVSLPGDSTVMLNLIDNPLKKKEEILERQRGVEEIISLDEEQQKSIMVLSQMCHSWIKSYKWLMDQPEDIPNQHENNDPRLIYYLERGLINVDDLDAQLDEAVKKAEDRYNNPLESVHIFSQEEGVLLHLARIRKYVQKIEEFSDANLGMKSRLLKILGGELKIVHARVAIPDYTTLVQYAVKRNGGALFQTLADLEPITKALKNIDVFYNFARLAQKDGYAKLTFDESKPASYKGGWLFTRKKKGWTPNDSPKDVGVVVYTGSNMSGKSDTGLKQDFFIQKIGQAFGYAPVVEGNLRIYDHIAYVDRPSTESTHDLSAFGKEVKNLLPIQKHAGENSKIYIDEGGSTTSPEDQTKLLIAFQKFAQSRKAHLVMTTHNEDYIDTLKGQDDVAVYHFKIKPEKDKIIFTHLMQEGPDDSNALEVARFLGLQEKILKRALKYLDGKEEPVSEIRKHELIAIARYTEEERVKLKNQVGDFLSLFPTENALSIHTPETGPPEYREPTLIWRYGDPNNVNSRSPGLKDPVFVLFSEDADFRPYGSFDYKDRDIGADPKDAHRARKIMHEDLSGARDLIMENASRDPKEILERQKMFMELSSLDNPLDILRKIISLDQLMVSLVSTQISIDWERFNIEFLENSLPKRDFHISYEEFRDGHLAFFLGVVEMNLRLSGMSEKDLGIDEELAKINALSQIAEEIVEIRNKERAFMAKHNKGRDAYSQKGWERQKQENEALNRQLEKAQQKYLDLAGITPKDDKERSFIGHSNIEKVIAELAQTIIDKSVKVLPAINLYEGKHWDVVREEMEKLYPSSDICILKHFSTDESAYFKVIKLHYLLKNENPLQELLSVLRPIDSVHIQQICNYLEEIFATWMNPYKTPFDYLQKIVDDKGFLETAADRIKELDTSLDELYKIRDMEKDEAQELLDKYKDIIDRHIQLVSAELEKAEQRLSDDSGYSTVQSSRKERSDKIKQRLENLKFLQSLQNGSIPIDGKSSQDLFGTKIKTTHSSLIPHYLIDLVQMEIATLQIRIRRLEEERFRPPLSERGLVFLRKEVEKFRPLVALAHMIKHHNWQPIELTDEFEIEMTDGWNPAKDKKGQVPLSLRMDAKEMARLYSGSNMSGKTFAEKTLIWNVLAGLATGFGPNAKLRIPIFEYVIFLDRITRQLDRDLSSFGQEVQFLKEFFDKIDTPGLVLGVIDEIGSTTSPRYQGPIFNAAGEEMLAQGHFYVTSGHHHEAMQRFMDQNNAHANIYHFKTRVDDAGKVIFDFELEEGHALSDGIKVARTLGLTEVLEFLPEEDIEHSDDEAMLPKDFQEAAYNIEESLKILYQNETVVPLKILNMLIGTLKTPAHIPLAAKMAEYVPDAFFCDSLTFLEETFDDLLKTNRERIKMVKALQSHFKKFYASQFRPNEDQHEYMLLRDQDLINLGLKNRGSSWNIDMLFPEFKKAPEQVKNHLAKRLSRPARTQEGVEKLRQSFLMFMKGIPQDQENREKAIENLERISKLISIYHKTLFYRPNNRQQSVYDYYTDRRGDGGFLYQLDRLREKHYPSSYWGMRVSHDEEYPDVTIPLMRIAEFVDILQDLHKMIPDEGFGKRWRKKIRNILERKELQPLLKRQNFFKLAHYGNPSLIYDWERGWTDEVDREFKELTDPETGIYGKLWEINAPSGNKRKDNRKGKEGLGDRHTFMRAFPSHVFHTILSEIDFNVRMALMFAQRGYTFSEHTDKEGVIKVKGFYNPFLVGKAYKKMVDDKRQEGMTERDALRDLARMMRGDFSDTEEEDDPDRPAFEKTNVEPLTFELGDGQNAVLLTGPNMGGKTETARAIVLAVLLNQTGLPLPAEWAELSLFRNIYSVFPRSDQLSEGHGYFGNLLEELMALTKQAGEGDLVILDEVPTGTDYYELVAVTTIIIEDLIKKGATVLVTGHLKKAMELIAERTGQQPWRHTAREDGKPDFKLEKGIAKRSYGIELTKEADFPGRVTELAKAYYDAILEGIIPENLPEMEDIEHGPEPAETPVQDPSELILSRLKSLFDKKLFAIPKSQEKVIEDIVGTEVNFDDDAHFNKILGAVSRKDLEKEAGGKRKFRVAPMRDQATNDEKLERTKIFSSFSNEDLERLSTIMTEIHEMRKPERRFWGDPDYDFEKNSKNLTTFENHLKEIESKIRVAPNDGMVKYITNNIREVLKEAAKLRECFQDADGKSLEHFVSVDDLLAHLKEKLKNLEGPLFSEDFFKYLKQRKDELEKNPEEIFNEKGLIHLQKAWDEYFTGIVRESLKSILSHLDQTIGVARSVKKHELVKPQYSDDNYVFSMEEAKPFLPRTGWWSEPPPFIEGGTPQKLLIDPQRPIQVLTGPNSSGKTVLFFTVHLNALLASRGFFTSGKVTTSRFKNVLSFFGGHNVTGQGESYFMNVLKKYSEILKLATPNSVVILDELHGSDNFELAAIQLAVLHYLRKKGVTVLYNTHIRDGLKIAADKLDLDLWKTNVSFDEETFEVTPHFTIDPDPNLDSQSLGLPIAKQWLSDEQFERAQRLYHQLADEDVLLSPETIEEESMDAPLSLEGYNLDQLIKIIDGNFHEIPADESHLRLLKYFADEVRKLGGQHDSASIGVALRHFLDKARYIFEDTKIRQESEKVTEELTVALDLQGDEKKIIQESIKFYKAPFKFMTDLVTVRNYHFLQLLVFISDLRAHKDINRQVLYALFKNVPKSVSRKKVRYKRIKNMSSEELLSSLEEYIKGVTPPNFESLLQSILFNRMAGGSRYVRWADVVFLQDNIVDGKDRTKFRSHVIEETTHGIFDVLSKKKTNGLSKNGGLSEMFSDLARHHLNPDEKGMELHKDDIKIVKELEKTTLEELQKMAQEEDQRLMKENIGQMYRDSLLRPDQTIEDFFSILPGDTKESYVSRNMYALMGLQKKIGISITEISALLFTLNDRYYISHAIGSVMSQRLLDKLDNDPELALRITSDIIRDLTAQATEIESTAPKDEFEKTLRPLIDFEEFWREAQKRIEDTVYLEKVKDELGKSKPPQEDEQAEKIAPDDVRAEVSELINRRSLQQFTRPLAKHGQRESLIKEIATQLEIYDPRAGTFHLPKKISRDTYVVEQALIDLILDRLGYVSRFSTDFMVHESILQPIYLRSLELARIFEASQILKETDVAFIPERAEFTVDVLRNLSQRLWRSKKMHFTENQHNKIEEAHRSTIHRLIDKYGLPLVMDSYVFPKYYTIVQIAEDMYGAMIHLNRKTFFAVFHKDHIYELDDEEGYPLKLLSKNPLGLDTQNVRLIPTDNTDEIKKYQKNAIRFRDKTFPKTKKSKRQEKYSKALDRLFDIFLDEEEEETTEEQLKTIEAIQKLGGILGRLSGGVSQHPDLIGGPFRSKPLNPAAKVPQLESKQPLQIEEAPAKRQADDQEKKQDLQEIAYESFVLPVNEMLRIDESGDFRALTQEDILEIFRRGAEKALELEDDRKDKKFFNRVVLKLYKALEKGDMDFQGKIQYSAGISEEYSFEKIRDDAKRLIFEAASIPRDEKTWVFELKDQNLYQAAYLITRLLGINQKMVLINIPEERGYSYDPDKKDVVHTVIAEAFRETEPLEGTIDTQQRGIDFHNRFLQRLHYSYKVDLEFRREIDQLRDKVLPQLNPRENEGFRFICSSRTQSFAVEFALRTGKKPMATDPYINDYWTSSQRLDSPEELAKDEQHFYQNFAGFFEKFEEVFQEKSFHLDWIVQEWSFRGKYRIEGGWYHLKNTLRRILTYNLLMEMLEKDDFRQLASPEVNTSDTTLFTLPGHDFSRPDEDWAFAHMLPSQLFQAVENFEEDEWEKHKTKILARYVELVNERKFDEQDFMGHLVVLFQKEFHREWDKGTVRHRNFYKHMPRTQAVIQTVFKATPLNFLGDDFLIKYYSRAAAMREDGTFVYYKDSINFHERLFAVVNFLKGEESDKEKEEIPQADGINALDGYDHHHPLSRDPFYVMILLMNLSPERFGPKMMNFFVAMADAARDRYGMYISDDMGFDENYYGVTPYIDFLYKCFSFHPEYFIKLFLQAPQAHDVIQFLIDPMSQAKGHSMYNLGRGEREKDVEPFVSQELLHEMIIQNSLQGNQLTILQTIIERAAEIATEPILENWKMFTPDQLRSLLKLNQDVEESHLQTMDQLFTTLGLKNRTTALFLSLNPQFDFDLAVKIDSLFHNDSVQVIFQFLRAVQQGSWSFEELNQLSKTNLWANTSGHVRYIHLSKILKMTSQEKEKFFIAFAGKASVPQGISRIYPLNIPSNHPLYQKYLLELKTFFLDDSSIFAEEDPARTESQEDLKRRVIHRSKLLFNDIKVVMKHSKEELSRRVRLIKDFEIQSAEIDNTAYRLLMIVPDNDFDELFHILSNNYTSLKSLKVTERDLKKHFQKIVEVNPELKELSQQTIVRWAAEQMGIYSRRRLTEPNAKEYIDNLFRSLVKKNNLAIHITQNKATAEERKRYTTLVSTHKLLLTIVANINVAKDFLNDIPNVEMDPHRMLTEGDEAMEAPDYGGIDMKDIELDRQGVLPEIQFDPTELHDMIQNGFDGFAPVIINIVPIDSVLPLLGLERPEPTNKRFELSELSD